VAETLTEPREPRNLLPVNFNSPRLPAPPELSLTACPGCSRREKRIGFYERLNAELAALADEQRRELAALKSAPRAGA